MTSCLSGGARAPPPPTAGLGPGLTPIGWWRPPLVTAWFGLRVSDLTPSEKSKIQIRP